MKMSGDNETEKQQRSQSPNSDKIGGVSSNKEEGNGKGDSSKRKDIKPSSAEALPRICLEACHRFHTNPALSSPQLYPNPNTSKSQSSEGGGKSKSSASVLSSIGVHSQNGHIQPGGTSKALKRKQRLAQYKAQAHGNTGEKAASGSKNKGVGGGNNGNGNGGIQNGLGEACHAVWAPNLNYSKNVELLAIASPLNINSSSNIGSSTSGGAGINNNLNNSSNVNQQQAVSQGSHVYILVFDEGTFAHCSEFSLASELCDLFGLPTQTMSTRSKTRRCGMRRTVFHNPYLNKSMEDNEISQLRNHQDKDNEPLQSHSNSQTQMLDKMSPSHVASQMQEKVQNIYSKLSTKYIMPFVSHLASEIDNCNNLFRYEVFDDGRIFGLPEGGPNQMRNQLSVAHQQQQVIKDFDTQEKRRDNSSDSDGKAPYPIRPQLVFHLNLPYSNTLMEVIGLEWNADGTNLSILQRRKGSSTGSSSSFSAISSAVSNKKKKSSLSAIAPGNTAVSFWSIPEWLHVTCDEVKMCEDDEELKFDGDGIIVKANNTIEGTIGWEVEKSDENTSLFPLWEWYLARYIFNDEILPAEHVGGTDNKWPGRRTKIMLKNCMEYSAYQMELATTANSSASASSARPKKAVSRGVRTAVAAGENANAMMNGDVTCLIWEDTSLYENDVPSDEDKENEDSGSKGGKEATDASNAEKEGDDSSNSKKKESPSSTSSKASKAKYHGPASKWVAVGTSKGQLLLHNVSASHASQQSKKASKKSGNDNSKAIENAANIPAQGRTITVPLRHKKRITCGTWVDNLLVFGNVSTGCITIVSTFPKSMVEDANAVEKDVFDSNSNKPSLFEEKTVKVLGTIPLPGGRDAVNIHMGFVEDELGKLTILSVNCEGKGLLFYSFPKAIDASNINVLASNITSSAAVEVIFSMTSSNLPAELPTQIKGGASCGNILFHYLIPNTLLVFVVFSSGYFVLVDWVSGVILSDVDVAMQAYNSLKEFDSKNSKSALLDENPIEHHENFILDVSYHVVTSTIACLTEVGVVLMYHLRLLDGCNDLKAGDCRCTTGIAISTKTHTRPKAKGSSSSLKHDNLVDCDPSVKRMMGTVDFLCSRAVKSIPSIQPEARRGNLINFSADGEAISISWGDESVEILGINMDDIESDRLKQRLAESMYLGKDHILSTFLFMVCVLIVWSWGKLS